MVGKMVSCTTVIFSTQGLNRSLRPFKVGSNTLQTSPTEPCTFYQVATVLIIIETCGLWSLWGYIFMISISHIIMLHIEYLLTRLWYKILNTFFKKCLIFSFQTCFNFVLFLRYCMQFYPSNNDIEHYSAGILWLTKILDWLFLF